MEKTADFSYIVVPEANNVTSIPTTTTTLTFNLAPGVPLEATDVYLQIVYHGQLGNEADAVAVGFKDISEPTPLDFRNDMDWACINGVNNPSGSTAAIENDYVAFTQSEAPRVVSSTYYHAYFARIDSGYYGRIYILGDNEGFWFSNQHNSLPPAGYFGRYGLVNQDETIDGIEYCNNPDFTTNRGLAEFDWYYFMLQPTPPTSVCPPIDGPVNGPVSATINQ